MNNWLTNRGIIFELSITYFQEENRVLEKIGKIIIERIRVIIFEGGIDHTMWLKVV